MATWSPCVPATSPTSTSTRAANPATARPSPDRTSPSRPRRPAPAPTGSSSTSSTRARCTPPRSRSVRAERRQGKRPPKRPPMSRRAGTVTDEPRDSLADESPRAPDPDTGVARAQGHREFAGTAQVLALVQGEDGVLRDQAEVTGVRTERGGGGAGRGVLDHAADRERVTGMEHGGRLPPHQLDGGQVQP